MLVKAQAELMFTNNSKSSRVSHRTSHVRLFATPGTAARPPSSSPSPTVCPSSCPSNCLILCHPLLLPSVFPSIGVFSNELANIDIYISYILSPPWLQMFHGQSLDSADTIITESSVGQTCVKRLFLKNSSFCMLVERRYKYILSSQHLESGVLKSSECQSLHISLSSTLQEERMGGVVGGMANIWLQMI